MKYNKILFILIFLLPALSTFGQERKLMPVDEIREVITLAIDLPSLQPYFHVETDSSRIPLIITEFGLINSEDMKGVKKFGQDIKILSESEINGAGIKSYLHIGDWTYGGEALRLQLEYVVEGILINYRFVKKDGRWKIENSLIMDNRH